MLRLWTAERDKQQDFETPLQTGNKENPEPAQIYILKFCFPTEQHYEKHFKEVLLSTCH